MGPFEMVVAIVAITMVAGIIREGIKYRAEAKAQPDEGVLEELRSLRERVEALEAIVTDQRYALKKEFDRLG